MKILLSCILSCFTIASAHAGLITNGGFESGLAGWTRADLLGSEGTFFVQSGTTSPVNGLPVPAPPQGSNAAMTDAVAGGSHILYQDFVVPSVVSVAFVRFSLFVNSGAEFETRDHLEWSLPDLNQQARVDILTQTSDPFSVAVGDVLQNLYRTETGDPLTSGYTPIIMDVTSLLQAHQGETLRLRFAEVDNVNIFNLGVDSVDIVEQVIPEPASWTLAAGALVALWAARRSRS
jgi:hypothetical protein